MDGAPVKVRASALPTGIRRRSGGMNAGSISGEGNAGAPLVVAVVVVPAPTTGDLGLQYTVSTVEMYNNVIVAPKASAKLFTIDDQTGPPAVFSGSNNWIVTGLASLPTPWTMTLMGADPGFVDPSLHDLRPTPRTAVVASASTMAARWATWIRAPRRRNAAPACTPGRPEPRPDDGPPLTRRERTLEPVPLTNCTWLWECAFRNWGMMQGPLKLEAREWDNDFHCFNVLDDPDEAYDLGEQAVKILPAPTSCGASGEGGGAADAGDAG